jgi:hypothetical protein
MTFSPENRSQERAPRVQLPGMPYANIRLQDGQRATAKLQTISVTGGLLRVLKPLTPGAVAEVMFWTDSGPVLGLAELLRPRIDASIGVQPFRFLTMDRTDRETLHAAIASSLAIGVSH